MGEGRGGGWDEYREGRSRSYIIQNKLSKDSPKASRTSPLHLTPASSFLHKTAAQLVKNPLVLETWVRSLDWEEEPLEKGTATHSGILA